MSHFVVMVIGDNPEQQLAPYAENLEVPEYLVEEVSEHDKQRMLDYYNENCEKPYTDFDKCYADNGEDWDGNRLRKNENGIWCEYSTYNPNSQWDWYLLGGRWSGSHFKLKPGAKSGVLGEPSWTNPTNRGYDAALKGDIDFTATTKEQFAPYAMVKDGQWYAKGKMGWWGVTTQAYCSDDEWRDKVWELVQSLPDDTLISFYDCHI